MKLFIVESPAKIKTLRKFLGKDFEIRASMGHIREIPKRGLGVDVGSGFQASFQLIESKEKNTRELLHLMKRAEEVYFAQDLDREGELIAWHLYDEASLDDKKVRRVVFNQITKKAVLDAISNPRDLNQHLIDAGMSRTILDRLIGYKLSPLVWNRFESDVPLSVGRVQTVALRILVDRDREIESFVKEEFWNIKAKFEEGFDADIHLKKDQKLGAEEKDALMAKLENPQAKVIEVNARQEKRKPKPPFTTATLQQEASSKLKYSAKETMKLAQELYEGVSIEGESKALITYMRTDAVNLAKEAQDSIRGAIERDYGKEYLPKKAVDYKGKTKNAQEAHEAIRPVYFDLPPQKVKPYLKPEQFKLYELIWNKAIACQMKPALFDSTTLRVDINGVEFRARGSVLKFEGFIKVYDDREIDNDNKKSAEPKNELPPVEEGQELGVKKLIPEKKFTKPPARYTEASLIKYLEKNGIGRPSTYASIIDTLIRRNYAQIKKRKFETTELGRNLCDWVRDHFPRVVDLKFTATVEDSLDLVARGERPWRDSVDSYYGPLRDAIVKLQGFVEEELQEEEKKCPECGEEMVVRSGKFGQFLGCSDYPKCTYIHKVRKPQRSRGITTGIFCEICSGEFHLKESRYGKYFACSSYPKCNNTRNKLTPQEVSKFKEHLREKRAKEQNYEQKSSESGKQNSTLSS